MTKERARPAKLVTDNVSPIKGVTAQVSRDLYNRFDALNEKQGVSNGASLRRLIEKYVQQQERLQRLNEAFVASLVNKEN